LAEALGAPQRLVGLVRQALQGSLAQSGFSAASRRCSPKATSGICFSKLRLQVKGSQFFFQALQDQPAGRVHQESLAAPGLLERRELLFQR